MASHVEQDTHPRWDNDQSFKKVIITTCVNDFTV